MNIRYVQIEPEIFDTAMMNLPAEKRKTYAILIIHMLNNGGALKDDISHLAETCGLTEIEMQRHLQFLACYFKRFRGRLYSQIIRFQIRRAEKWLQDHRTAGVIGAQIKQRRLSDAEATLMGKGKRENIPSLKEKGSALIPLPSMEFARVIAEIIPLKKPQDWIAVQNVAVRIARLMREGKCTFGVYQVITALAKEASAKKVPIKYFFSLLKYRLGYKRQSRGATGMIGDMAKELIAKIGVKDAG